MRVLFLGAHCDDIELGCGGLINQRFRSWDIACLTLSRLVVNSSISLQEYSIAALSTLGVSPDQIEHRNYHPSNMPTHVDDIWADLRAFTPDVVFTQEPDDHQDHTVLYETTLRAFNPGTSVITYRATSRSCPVFNANLYAPLTPEELAAKVVAIEKYQPVYSHKPYLRPEAIKAQAVVDGLAIGCEAAEAFRVVRASTRIF